MTKTTGIFKEVLNAPISDQQIINLTEAAMIRHFQPEFNIRFHYCPVKG